jgi:hypothetical protein
MSKKLEDLCEELTTQIVKDKMSGKTTRKVDEAIQKIFKYGFLHIPSKRQIESTVVNCKSAIECDPDTIIIDEDWVHSDGVQSALMDKIVRRLMWEHGIEVKVDFTDNTIELKDKDKEKHGIQ